MKKNPIGIIDVSCDGICILNDLQKNFKNEDFLYFNDIKNLPYEGKDSLVILKYIKKNVEYMLEQGIKMLIVISDTIIEYGSEYLEGLNIPVISIVQSIIDYLNINYENKNMLLCAKDYILKANLYQKNIKYSHLNTVSSNKMEVNIKDNKVKTMKSFNACNDSFRAIASRDFDVFVYTAPWIWLLKTEILEYIKVKDFIKVGDIISGEVKKKLDDSYKKGQGKIFVHSTVLERDFKDLIPWFKLKYKYTQVVIDYDQNRTIQKDN